MFTKKTFFIILSFFLFTGPVLASGDFTEISVRSYQLTIDKIEISQDGTNYVTLLTGPKTVIVTENDSTNSKISDLFSTVSVPVGSYTHQKVTVSAIVAAFEFTYGGTHYYSQSNGSFNTTSPATPMSLTVINPVWSGQFTPPAEFIENQTRLTIFAEYIGVADVSYDGQILLDVPAVLAITDSNNAGNISINAENTNVIIKGGCPFNKEK